MKAVIFGTLVTKQVLSVVITSTSIRCSSSGALQLITAIPTTVHFKVLVGQQSAGMVGEPEL